MATVVTYLAQRLYELGISDYFAIPGDYNLGILDELLKYPALKMHNCCNELNGGYAADGYARIKGAGALVVTFSVGGLSAINAIAGAYSENLPLIVVSGAPNTNSVQDAEILHHTLAEEDTSYVRRMYAHVTALTTFIHRPEDAPMQIDRAIAVAMDKRKPVYIEIACNIPAKKVSTPTKSAHNAKRVSDSSSLKAALKHASEKLNQAVKPVIVAGSKMRPCNACKEVAAFSKATGYALAVMPDAKGFVSEEHPNFIGVYWGPVSSPACAEIIESSDLYLFIGPVFNDYTTVGHVCNINKKKSIILEEGRVSIGGAIYTNVYMHDFLQGLQRLVKFNNTAYKAYTRIKEVVTYPEPTDLKAPVTRRFLLQQIQKMLSKNHAVIAETGDSWFNALDLTLPEGCLFEIQMQYGSIGWSVGALLGMQTALKDQKRVIACIGDGSFQMTAQELSTLIRYDYHPIIFLMNNSAYTIEVQIHDGEYNKLNNWDYSALVKAFNGNSVKAQAFKVKSSQDLTDALKEVSKTKALCFIEVMLDKNDCNKHLLDWGSRVQQY